MVKNTVEDKTCSHLTVSGGCNNHRNAEGNATDGEISGVKGGALCRLANQPENQFMCHGFGQRKTPTVDLSSMTPTVEAEISRRVYGHR